MPQRRLPIFIATPFLGQGDIHNQEWIDGRTELFEAVTKNSLLNLVGDDVHWLVFLGKEPLPQVEAYAHRLFSDHDYVHPVRMRHSSDNVTTLAREISPVDRYITTIIADDDAWPSNYIDTIRHESNRLLDEGHEHAGLTFANGLEWVMADQVDINFLVKSNFHLLRKQNLVEYRYPWLGCGFFVLQTKSQPFNSLCVAHPQIPKYLEREGFSLHVAEEPRRAWLYNRHQLSASSLVKSESEPLPLDLDELEGEFGIDANRVRNWTNTRFSTYYSEKIHGVEIQRRENSIIEMYDFPDLEDFVHMPFKSFFFQDNHLVIDPVNHFNIRPPFRLRVYNSTSKTYEMLLVVEKKFEKPFEIPKSFFDASCEYKFDVQRRVEGTWQRVMPFVFIKHATLSRSNHNIASQPYTHELPSLDDQKDVRITLKKKGRTLQMTFPSSRCRILKLNDSMIGKTSMGVEASTEGGWAKIR